MLLTVADPQGLRSAHRQRYAPTAMWARPQGFASTSTRLQHSGMLHCRWSSAARPFTDQPTRRPQVAATAHRARHSVCEPQQTHPAPWHRELQAASALVVVGCMAAASLLSAAPAHALDVEASQAVFNAKCIGCHQGGGNILAVGASLFPEDLTRNGYTTPEALYTLIYSGKGKMPGFGKDCAPRGQCTFTSRLTDEQVKDVAELVLLRAEQGWK